MEHTVLWTKKSGKKHLTLRIEPVKANLLLDANSNSTCIIKVTSSARTARRDILNFLLEKKTWIETTASKLKDLHHRFAAKEIKDGETFPLLGYQLRLQIKFSVSKTKQKSTKIVFNKDFKNQLLICEVIAASDESTTLSSNYFSKIENQKKFFVDLQRFYLVNAKNYLHLRLDELSKLTQLPFLNLSIRNQRSRWGSCSSRKTISLNYKMIALSPSLIDYILIHELCHTLHMNHSNSFWNLVESFFPTYLEAEKLLKEQQHLTNFLNTKL